MSKLGQRLIAAAKEARAIARGGLKMAVKTAPFDPADYLDTGEAQAAYLDEAFATGDVSFIADALGVIARARGMTEISQASGLGRESLYKSLTERGNPEFGTVLKVLGAMGLQLHVMPADKQPA